jgi:hypothetical protein
MDVYFQLFRDVVGERESEPVDDVTPTKEELKDKGKDKINRKKGPQMGRSKEVRGAAGFTEVHWQDDNAELLSNCKDFSVIKHTPRRCPWELVIV